MKKVVFPYVLTCLTVGIFMSAHRAQAGLAAPLTLAWNPADDSTIKGYAIYYGPSNQPATNRVDAGLNSTVTIFNMVANVPYRLFAVSYNSSGVESIPSNELLLTQAAVSKLKITRQSTGSMKLVFSAAPGTVGRIQYASKPAGSTWQTLTTTTTDSAGNGSFIDTGARQASSRFYRVAVP